MTVKEYYIAERSKLIPEAESFANAVCGVKAKPGTDSDKWRDKWNQCYLQQMTKLAKERGI